MSHDALYSNQSTRESRSLTQKIVGWVRRRVFDPAFKYAFTHMTAPKKFHILGKPYDYLIHPYNYTWTNERTVEIAYFHQFLQKYKGKRILEVGNTLSHYYPSSHIVVDKYEQAPGVLSIDVLDYKPKQKFDLIFAISTLEHIGWHESEKRASKALEALVYLQSLLSPKGKLVFSIPIGVNPALDQAIRAHALPMTSEIFLRRKNWWNEWEECIYAQIKTVKYNTPYPNANAILIGVVAPK